jgi:tetratricopeptide (TPR) repeat protein
VGELIGLYEFGGLDETDKVAFRAHIIECEYCHEQSYSMEPFAIVFRDHRTAMRRNQTGASVLPAFSSAWGLLAWAVKQTVPLTVSVLLLVAGAFVIWQAPWKPTPRVEVSRFPPIAGSGTNSRWTNIEVPKPNYTAPKTNVLLREPDKMFARAMTAYQRDDLAAAIEQLQTLSEMQPSDLGEVSFYEGVSLLLVGRSQDAITALRRAMVTGDDRQMEKSRYYLALTYLKLDQPQQAIAEVEAIIESGGEYLSAAKQLSEKISDVLKNPD